MAGGLDEVKTSMDAVVYNLQSVNTVLLLQVGVETGFNVLQDGSPAKMAYQARRVWTENFRTCRRCLQNRQNQGYRQQ